MKRFLWLAAALLACQPKPGQSDERTSDSTMTHATPPGTFGDDVAFLNRYQQTIVLRAIDNDSARVAVVPAYQGRVMTSTARGTAGTSYGWINYEPIRTGTYQPHMHAYGGEDRFWLAPEGGPFSIFFPPGAPFTFDNWQTPPLIDTVAYAIDAVSTSSVSFLHRAELRNYSGTRFEFDIRRRVQVLSRGELARYLGAEVPDALDVVGFETINELKNTGPNWQRNRGLLAVWILGMFPAGAETTMLIPMQGTDGLTDDYFNRPGPDRLRREGTLLHFRADAAYRSKIGLTPAATTGWAGSYDAPRGILTLVQFDVDPEGAYLKSTWQHHTDPYGGDAFNAYNDGPVNGRQMGTFYELESTSPARALRTGEILTHRHRTFHLEGPPAALQSIARRLLGVRVIRN